MHLKDGNGAAGIAFVDHQRARHRCNGGDSIGQLACEAVVHHSAVRYPSRKDSLRIDLSSAHQVVDDLLYELVLSTRIAGDKRVATGFGSATPKQDLLKLKGQIEAGDYRPVIDRVYRMDQVVEAARLSRRSRRWAT